MSRSTLNKHAENMLLKFPLEYYTPLVILANPKTEAASHRTQIFRCSRNYDVDSGVKISQLRLWSETRDRPQAQLFTH